MLKGAIGDKTRITSSKLPKGLIMTKNVINGAKNGKNSVKTIIISNKSSVGAKNGNASKINATSKQDATIHSVSKTRKSNADGKNLNVNKIKKPNADVRNGNANKINKIRNAKIRNDGKSGNDSKISKINSVLNNNVGKNHNVVKIRKNNVVGKNCSVSKISETGNGTTTKTTIEMIVMVVGITTETIKTTEMVNGITITATTKTGIMIGRGISRTEINKDAIRNNGEKINAVIMTNSVGFMNNVNEFCSSKDDFLNIGINNFIGKGFAAISNGFNSGVTTIT